MLKENWNFDIALVYDDHTMPESILDYEEESAEWVREENGMSVYGVNKCCSARKCEGGQECMTSWNDISQAMFRVAQKLRSHFNGTTNTPYHA